MNVEAEPSDQHAQNVTSMRLAPLASQIAEARRFVRDEVRRRHASQIEDAELLASEAVGNAVRHAATEDIIVTVAEVGDVIRVFVHDDDPTPPILVQPDPTTAGGHGMHLIDQLAAEWGVTSVEGDGKRLWFVPRRVDLGERSGPGPGNGSKRGPRPPLVTRRQATMAAEQRSVTPAGQLALSSAGPRHQARHDEPPLRISGSSGPDAP